MNNDQKGQRDLTDDVKIMPDDVNFVKPGKANLKIIDSKLDDTIILQIDGGIITGLLVFLTLTSLIPIVSGPYGNVSAIVFTAGVIFPFAISAIMVLSKYIESPITKIDKIIAYVKKHSRYAGNATFWGFVYLMGVIAVLFIFNLWPLFYLAPSPLTEVCEENPADFDIERDLCARIKSGSFYEECVKNACQI
jgi:hypothetical protein